MELWSDKIPGGLADNKLPSSFDKEALSKGIEIELEHTSDDSIATEIAMDHLTEDPLYYYKLEIMEMITLKRLLILGLLSSGIYLLIKHYH